MTIASIKTRDCASRLRIREVNLKMAEYRTPNRFASVFTILLVPIASQATRLLPNRCGELRGGAKYGRKLILDNRTDR
jgi:hypothetical protein